jgi:hypothetical protein
MAALSTLFFAILCTANVVHAAPERVSISDTARCGKRFSLTCKGSSFGSCCSKSGWCGSSKDYCGEGCQASWGSCASPKPSPLSPSTNKVSKDGKCGDQNGAYCVGSGYGNRCRYVSSTVIANQFFLRTMDQSIRLLRFEQMLLWHRLQSIDWKL